MDPAKYPMVPTTLLLHESVMVPATETNGSCNRDIWFLQQSHMVPPWFLQQRHMVPAIEPNGSCNRAHGSSKRAMWFLKEIS
jgi:hypothetical protein